MDKIAELRELAQGMTLVELRLLLAVARTSCHKVHNANIVCVNV